MALKKRIYNFSPLFGGCRYVDDVLSINRDEAYILENCHITERGIAYTRSGSRRLNSVSPVGTVTSIHEYNRPFGSSIVREILVTIGDNWYSFDGSTLIRLSGGGLSTSNKPSVVTFNDGSNNSIAILANGKDFVKYDGTSVTPLISDFAGTYVASQRPKYLFVYDNRLLSSGCIDTPTRIYASGLLDPTSYDADGYFSYDDDGDKEPMTGIGSAWSFLIAFKKNSIYMDNEGNPQSASLVQTRIAKGAGTSSHWSIVTEGSNIHFASSEGFFSGILRQQIDEGLEVHKTSANIQKKFNEVTSFDEIEGIFDARHREIRWGVKTNNSTSYNLEFVYNTALSGLSPSGQYKDIWNGWWKNTSYEPAVYGLITNTDGSSSIYRGDSNGKIYIMEEDFTFKDDDSSGTEQDIATEIHLGPLLPGGLAQRKNFRKAIIYLFQNVNGSTVFSFNNSGRYRSSNTTMELDGVIPYWRDDYFTTEDATKTQTWGNTLWADAPMLPYPMSINEFGSFLELVISNNGSENHDKISYGGGQLIYQVRKGL